MIGSFYCAHEFNYWLLNCPLEDIGGLDGCGPDPVLAGEWRSVDCQAGFVAGTINKTILKTGFEVAAGT